MDAPVPPGELRDWAWVRAPGGPDTVFAARFAPGDAAALAHAVRTTPLPGLLPDDDPADGDSAALSYCDAWTHATLLEQRRTGARRNVYIFESLLVTEFRLEIVRGYGGHEGEWRASESALLARLATAPELTLERWEVRYEEAGAHATPVAQGSTGASLLAHLGGRSPTPDLRQAAGSTDPSYPRRRWTPPA